MRWEYRVIVQSSVGDVVEKQINRFAEQGFELASHAMAASAAGETNLSVIMRRQVWEGMGTRRDEENPRSDSGRTASQ